MRGQDSHMCSYRTRLNAQGLLRLRGIGYAILNPDTQLLASGNPQIDSL